uniref:Envelope protein n=1 Tax=Gasterosteus aculeatus aculeatus TaxID=481459 RepID=A0AAQ4RXE1_GASAC
MERQRSWNPLRRLGGTRVTMCLFAGVTLFVLIPYFVLHQKHLDDLLDRRNNSTHSNSTIRNRTKRALTRLDNRFENGMNPLNKYSANMWWRYAQHVATKENASDCYVCSPLPISTNQPRLAVAPLGKSEGCFCGLSVSGWYVPPIVLYISNDSDKDSLFIYELSPWETIDDLDCAQSHDIKRYTASQTSTFALQAQESRTRFPLCYARDGTHPVGKTDPARCDTILIAGNHAFNDLNCNKDHFPTFRNDCAKNHNRSFCQAKGTAERAAKVPIHLQKWSCSGWTFTPVNPRDCPPNVNCSVFHFTFLPGKNGTYPVTEGWWLCGTTLRVSLPPQWSGICTPVRVTDHTFILTATTGTSKRTKRMAALDTGLNPEVNFAPHNSIWGSDVPDEFKHASTSVKVLWGLFPWTGVGKNTLRLETVDYRFKSFVNMTLAGLKGIREEMTAMRLMIMQNRMVLDQLTAAQGGVCAIVGEYCCTFIPENDKDEGIIHQAIQNMTKLQESMTRDKSPSPDWLTRVWYSWKGTLIQAATILCVLFAFVICGIPLIRHTIAQLLAKQMAMYSLGSPDDSPPNLFPRRDSDNNPNSDPDSLDELNTYDLDTYA